MLDGATTAQSCGSQPCLMRRLRMSERRLIGIDLAWGKKAGTDYDSRDCEGSGCAEFIWVDGELWLTRLDLLHSMDQIVKWIEPERGNWVVAVDAPLVVDNGEGRRKAEEEVSEAYRRYDAGAHSTNLDADKEHRGVQLRKALKEQGGRLLECAGSGCRGNLILETYPHPATIELFDLNLIIKYKKKGMSPEQRRVGQQELADRIRTHFCDRPAGPRLRRDDCLTNLLSELDPEATHAHKKLKEREDKLDGLICAYVAAWADAGRCLQRFGVVGKGVMFIPCLRRCTGMSLG